MVFTIATAFLDPRQVEKDLNISPQSLIAKLSIGFDLKLKPVADGQVYSLEGSIEELFRAYVYLTVEKRKAALEKTMQAKLPFMPPPPGSATVSQQLATAQASTLNLYSQLTGRSVQELSGLAALLQPGATGAAGQRPPIIMRPPFLPPAPQPQVGGLGQQQQQQLQHHVGGPADLLRLSGVSAAAAMAAAALSGAAASQQQRSPATVLSAPSSSGASPLRSHSATSAASPATAHTAAAVSTHASSPLSVGGGGGNESPRHATSQDQRPPSNTGAAPPPAVEYTSVLVAPTSSNTAQSALAADAIPSSATSPCQSSAEHHHLSQTNGSHAHPLQHAADVPATAPPPHLPTHHKITLPQLASLEAVSPASSPNSVRTDNSDESGASSSKRRRKGAAPKKIGRSSVSSEPALSDAGTVSPPDQQAMFPGMEHNPPAHTNGDLSDGCSRSPRDSPMTNTSGFSDTDRLMYAGFPANGHGHGGAGGRLLAHHLSDTPMLDLQKLLATSASSLGLSPMDLSGASTTSDGEGNWSTDDKELTAGGGTGGRGNQCSLCGKVCKSSRALTFHLKSYHCGSEQSPNGKTPVLVKNRGGVHQPYPCRICGKLMMHKASLRNHEMTHTQTPKFQCEICTRGFHVKYFLQRHMAAEHGIGGYKCNLCNKHFSRHYSFQQHVDLHHKNMGGGGAMSVGGGGAGGAVSVSAVELTRLAGELNGAPPPPPPPVVVKNELSVSQQQATTV